MNEWFSQEKPHHKQIYRWHENFIGLHLHSVSENTSYPICRAAPSVRITDGRVIYGVMAKEVYITFEGRGNE